MILLYFDIRHPDGAVLLQIHSDTLLGCEEQGFQVEIPLALAPKACYHIDETKNMEVFIW